MHKQLLFTLLLAGNLFNMPPLFAQAIARNQPANAPTQRAPELFQSGEKLSLRDALMQLKKQYGVDVLFEEKLLDGLNVSSNLLTANTGLEPTLSKLLRTTNLRYRRIRKDAYLIVTTKSEPRVDFQAAPVLPEPFGRSESGMVSPVSQPVLASPVAVAADLVVKGNVTSDRGESLPGVSVIIKGSLLGTVTDARGAYSLTVPNPEATLVFSYVGMITQEVAVNNQATINVSLTTDTKSLGEVVVVGYGTQNKAEVTGSIASLNTKSIRDMPVSNIAEGMAGRLPGVLVQQASGAPGSGPSIKIRGLGSISAGNGPLFVIDGQPLNSGDLVNGSNLSLLNPSDIETIDVLKDASATAIFGSRGANGVVVITTKRGKAGKSTLSFNYYTGVQQVTKKLDMLDSQQFAELSRDAANNAYVERVPGAKASDPNASRPGGLRYRYPRGEYLGINFDNPESLAYYDYQDLIFQSAPISNYQLAGSGGTDKVQYMVSGNYLKQDGIIKRSGIDRFTFRSNVDAQLSSKIKVGMSISPSYTVEQRVLANGHWVNGAIINSALDIPPFVPVYKDDGTYFSMAAYSGLYDAVDSSNPVANIYEVDNDVSTLRLLGNTYIQVDFLKNLQYRGSIGGDLVYFRQNQFRTSAIPLSGLAPPNVSTGASSTDQNINWVTNHTLTYKLDLGADHHFNLLAGVEAQKNTFESNTVTATNFPNDIARTVNAGVISGGSSQKEQWSLASYFSRISYNYKEKYLFNASVRQDGSSRFGVNQRNGLFPSASVGWRLSEEPFGKKLAGISELKLKASFGLSGNNAFDNYGSVGILGADNYVFGGVLSNGLAATRIGNPNLTWEKSQQTDIGVELGLFSNRIFLTADYYSRITSDLLLAVQIPTITGFTVANQNIGRVRNTGVEFSVNTRNLVGPFTWTTDVNFSLNRNKVLALGPTGDPIRSGSGVNETNITVLGEPLGNFYGYKQIGVFKDQADLDVSPRFQDARPGDVKYADVNNDGKIDANDRTILGNNQPDFIYGLTNTFTYKGFDLSVVIQGVQGGQILNLSRRFIENLEGNQNQLTTVLDRWRSAEQPGNGIVPRANSRTTGNSNAISSRWVEEATYFRIRNITLGYNIPRKLTDRIKLQNLRVYAGVQNLLTVSKYLGYNPEVSGYESALTGGVDYGAYPLARTVTAGLNLSL